MTSHNTDKKRFITSLKNLRLWGGFLSVVHKSTWIVYAIFLLLLMFPVIFGNIFNFYFLQNSIQSLFESLPIQHVSPLIIFVPLIIVISVLSRIVIWVFAKLRRREIRLIEEYVRALFPRFRFSTVVHIGQQIFQKSRLFKITHTSIVSAYGILKARLDDRDIVILDVGLRENTNKQKLGDTLAKIPILGMFISLYRIVVKTIFTKKIGENLQYNFRGIFAHTDSKIDFSGSVLILPNKLGTDPFSQMIKNFDTSRGELVELENDAFNQVFTVYGFDQIETRYLLSVSFMEKLLDLQKIVDAPLSLSFNDAKLYLALYIPDGVFGFATKKAMTTNHLEIVQAQIESVISIFETINLDEERG